MFFTVTIDYYLYFDENELKNFHNVIKEFLTVKKIKIDEILNPAYFLTTFNKFYCIH